MGVRQAPQNRVGALVVQLVQQKALFVLRLVSAVQLVVLLFDLSEQLLNQVVFFLQARLHLLDLVLLVHRPNDLFEVEGEAGVAQLLFHDIAGFNGGVLALVSAAVGFAGSGQMALGSFLFAELQLAAVVFVFVILVSQVADSAFQGRLLNQKLLVLLVFVAGLDSDFVGVLFLVAELQILERVLVFQLDFQIEALVRVPIAFHGLAAHCAHN